MAIGSYKVPAEMKDEDKWGVGKIQLTKRQLIPMAIAFVVGGMVFVFFAKLGLLPVGLFFFFIIFIATGLCTFISVPSEKYLIGGGEKISTILFRLLIKQRKSAKIIYVKNYKSTR